MTSTIHEKCIVELYDIILTHQDLPDTKQVEPHYELLLCCSLHSLASSNVDETEVAEENTYSTVHKFVKVCIKALIIPICKT